MIPSIFFCYMERGYKNNYFLWKYKISNIELYSSGYISNEKLIFVKDIICQKDNFDINTNGNFMADIN